MALAQVYTGGWCQVRGSSGAAFCLQRVHPSDHEFGETSLAVLVPAPSLASGELVEDQTKAIRHMELVAKAVHSCFGIIKNPDILTEMPSLRNP